MKHDYSNITAEVVGECLKKDTHDRGPLRSMPTRLMVYRVMTASDPEGTRYHGMRPADMVDYQRGVEAKIRRLLKAHPNALKIRSGNIVRWRWTPDSVLNAEAQAAREREQTEKNIHDLAEKHGVTVKYQNHKYDGERVVMSVSDFQKLCQK